MTRMMSKSICWVLPAPAGLAGGGIFKSRKQMNTNSVPDPLIYRHRLSKRRLAFWLQPCRSARLRFQEIVTTVVAHKAKEIGADGYEIVDAENHLLCAEDLEE